MADPATVGAEIAKDAAKEATTWLSRQNVDTIFTFLILCAAISYAVYQVGWGDPRRERILAELNAANLAARKESDESNQLARKEQVILSIAARKESDERHEKLLEAQDARHAKTLSEAMEHGERSALENRKLLEKVFGKPVAELIKPPNENGVHE